MSFDSKLKSNSKTIGKGSYGTVIKKDNKVIKSCKIFYYENNDFYLDDHSIREAIFYQIVNKDRLFNKESEEFDTSIPLVTVTIEHNQSLHFEMDYYGQTLTNFKFINKEKTIELFKHILLSLYSLHSHGFSHGDLKPDNILIDTNNNKSTIIDYGSICLWHNSTIQPNTYQRCTLYYVSPEELSDTVFSIKNDIWSFGVILFEYISGTCFIRTLLKDCGVNEKDQELFYEYSIQSKVDTIFNPTTFLSNFFQSISYSQIFNVITKFIKDRDFQKIIGHCLLKDTNIRCTAEKLLQSNIFKCDIQSEAKFKRNSSIHNYNINHLTPLSDKTRNNIQDLIWKWCLQYTNFGKSMFCHSVMLFDRILLRLNESTLYIPYSILALCCIVLSVMILKGNLIRASTMISIYDEYEISNNNIKLEEYKSITTENIKYYFGLIFSQTQFYLFYKSPDMYLYEENIPINYNILRDILKKYLITSSSSIHIAGKYYEEYSK